MFAMPLEQGCTVRAVILTAKGFAPSMQARFTMHVLNKNRYFPALLGKAR